MSFQNYFFYLFLISFVLIFMILKIFFSENKIEINASAFDSSLLEKFSKEQLLAYELVFLAIISVTTRIVKFVLTLDISFISNFITYYGVSSELFQILILILSFVIVQFCIGLIPITVFQQLQKNLFVSIRFWVPFRVSMVLENTARTNPYIVVAFLLMFGLWVAYSFPEDSVLLLGQFSFILKFFLKIRENLCIPVVYKDGTLDEQDLYSRINSMYSQTSFIKVKKPLILKNFILTRKSREYIMAPWVQKRSISGLIGTVSRAVSNKVNQGVIAVGGLGVLGGGIFWGIERLEYKMSEDFSEIKESLKNSSQELESLRQEYKNDSISGVLSGDRREKASELINSAIDEEKTLAKLVLEKNKAYSRILNSRSLDEATKKASSLHDLTAEAGRILANTPKSGKN